MFLQSELVALVSVIVIDLVLAGDNAIVVGMAAAGLPQELRKKAIVVGIAAAALLRIFFALFTTQLLNVIGLVLAGGLLLLWVAWKLWRETRNADRHRQAMMGADHGATLAADPLLSVAGDDQAVATPRKSLRAALLQIVAADVSMSLDNVLAVAGTARHHLWVLVIGLSFSVALMGLAATLVARILKRYPWVSYVGLALIAWVALAMIWEGGRDVFGLAVRSGVL
jgi:YjbE family integral membrane protein